MIIAITGTIGSGKSTVSNYFKEKGFEVFDADKMVHAYYNIGSDVYQYLLNEYGSDILNDDKTLNNKALAKIVFSDYRELDKLEGVVYPIVEKEILEIKEKSQDKIVFIEVPLLIEANMEQHFDKVIMVDAPQNVRHQRLKNKGYTQKDIDGRETRQFTSNIKRQKSDIIIDNDQDLKSLFEKLQDLEKRGFDA